MTQSTWGSMLNEKFVKPKEGYAMHHMEHVGENPMWQERLAKAFTPKAPKAKAITSPVAPKIGSPWHLMAGGK